MDNRNNDRDFFEEFEKTGNFIVPPKPVKEEKCRSSITLAAVGAIAGLFIPFIGITFALAGIYVNVAEQDHYNMAPGFKANFISIGISLASWIIALILRPLVT